MNTLLNKAEKWLNGFGIRTISHPNCLLVSRDEMDNLFVFPVDTYDTFLDEIKTGIDSKRLHWTHKDDLWLYLETL